MTSQCAICKYHVIEASPHRLHGFHTVCQRCGSKVFYDSREEAMEAARRDHCEHHVPKWKPMDPDKFWRPEGKEPVSVRIIQPDNVVECVDNVGIEEQFELGAEYIFEEHKSEGMIYVYDKLGTKRECFVERFKVKSAEHGAMYHFQKKRGDVTAPAHQR